MHTKTAASGSEAIQTNPTGSRNTKRKSTQGNNQRRDKPDGTRPSAERAQGGVARYPTYRVARKLNHGSNSWMMLS